MIVVIPAGRSWPLRSRYEVSTIVRVVYLLSVTIHVLAAMTWVGGMLLFVVAVMPTIRRQHDPVRRAFLEDFGPRFRIVARASILVLTLATGSGCLSAGTAAGGAALDPRGAWFVKTGCTACHSVSVYGLSNPAARAPDLSLAVEDVPRRFGRSLDDFLRQPTGTMSMVLSSSITLSEREKEAAIERIKEAYAVHQQRSAPIRPVPSH